MQNLPTVYKNAHLGRTGIIFGTGPSLLKYSTDISVHSDSIKVGVNSIIYHDVNLELDYFFIQDTLKNDKSLKTYHKKKEDYDKFKVSRQKFYGVSDGRDKNKDWFLTIRDCQQGDAVPYQINTVTDFAFKRNLDSEAVGAGRTVIMSAIQFLIYTGIRKIYLVGIDCSGNRVNEAVGGNYKGTLLGWDKMKAWISTLSDIEIVSINPVGLKKYFKYIIV